MFSRKTVVILGVLVFIAANALLLTLNSRSHSPALMPYRVVLSLVAPFQEMIIRWVRLNENIWHHYFYLVTVAEENSQLKQAVADAEAKLNRYEELTLANQRLRRLLEIKQSTTREVVAAEVIGRDPSPWFKTVIINKGKVDGIDKGYPVVMAEGIVGQIIEISKSYAKVLLLIDRKSAVDGVVQRSRARGVVKGGAETQCTFDYLLRKHDISVGDMIVTSGLDGVYPKGLPIGRVVTVDRPHAGIFQHVRVAPFVDFEKLEEVIVTMPPLSRKLDTGR